MIAVIIIFLAVIVISASLSNGQWEVAALFGGIAVLLLLMGAGERHDSRAHINRLNYWADGGPDSPEWKRDARKRNFERMNPRPGRYSTERELTSRDLRDACRKRERFKEELASGEAMLSKQPSRVCHYCGRFVYAGGRRVQTEMGAAIEYSCPVCGRINRTKLGT